MPELCCDCTAATRRLTRVARSRELATATKESSDGAVVVLLLYMLFGGFAFLIHVLHSLLGWKSPNSQGVVVRIRQCRECSRRKAAEPIFVNYDAYTMKFVVHRDFATMFEEANRKGAG